MTQARAGPSNTVRSKIGGEPNIVELSDKSVNSRWKIETFPSLPLWERVAAKPPGEGGLLRVAEAAVPLDAPAAPASPSVDGDKSTQACILLRERLGGCGVDPLA